MKFRSVALCAALVTASAAALAAPSSAQTRGGITLSFVTGGYSSYDYDADEDYPLKGYYAYSVPQYQSYYNYYQSSYASQAWAPPPAAGALASRGAAASMLAARTP